jgi:hypothetical protein
MKHIHTTFKNIYDYSFSLRHAVIRYDTMLFVLNLHVAKKTVLLLYTLEMREKKQMHTQNCHIVGPAIILVQTAKCTASCPPQVRVAACVLSPQRQASPCIARDSSSSVLHYEKLHDSFRSST